MKKCRQPFQNKKHLDLDQKNLTNNRHNNNLNYNNNNKVVVLNSNNNNKLSLSLNLVVADSKNLNSNSNKIKVKSLDSTKQDLNLINSNNTNLVVELTRRKKDRMMALLKLKNDDTSSC